MLTEVGNNELLFVSEDVGVCDFIRHRAADTLKVSA